MKRLAPLFLLMAVHVHAEESTAYSALRAVKAKIPDMTTRLLEVKGSRGEPQPKEWTVLLTDANARGGVRELTVVSESIVAERTPVKSGTAGNDGAIDVAKLNLDSDGAFRVAEHVAFAGKMGFDWVEYSLTTTPGSGAPKWTLRLFNQKGKKVGEMEISAENGQVLVPMEIKTSSADHEEPVETANTDKKVGGLIGEVRDKATGVVTKVKDTTVNVANKVKDTTVNTAGDVQEVLTGDRTIGTKPADD